MHVDNYTEQNIKTVANKSNAHYAQLGERMANEVSKLSVPGRSDNPVPIEIGYRSLYFVPVDTTEIGHIIDKLRGGSAPGMDEITVNTLKMNKNSFSKPIEHIINLSLSTGVYPDAFKSAKIIPIYKAGSKLLPDNFRPISLMSVFSKIIDKCVKSRLTSFLKANNVMSENQFGFKENQGTHEAIYNFTKQLHKGMDKGKKILAIFLDLAKAFDTVSRRRLLKKLESIGVRGLPLQWFESYLQGRRQCVCLEGVCGDELTINYGVCQGTTLGPTLFNIYINDLCDMIIRGKIFVFADDTAILCEGDT